MTEAATEDAAQFLARQIERAKGFRLAQARSLEHSARRVLLRRWQAARLAATHKDLVEHPEYGPAMQFFLSDLYGIKDVNGKQPGSDRAMLGEPAQVSAAAIGAP